MSVMVIWSLVWGLCRMQSINQSNARQMVVFCCLFLARVKCSTVLDFGLWRCVLDGSRPRNFTMRIKVACERFTAPATPKVRRCATPADSDNSKQFKLALDGKNPSFLWFGCERARLSGRLGGIFLCEPEEPMSRSSKPKLSTSPDAKRVPGFG